MFFLLISILDTNEEKDKLTAIYERYRGTMLSVAKSIISDPALAEDAVSDAFMSIVKNLHKIDEISSHKSKAYIVIIVRSRALNILNKQKKHPEEPLEDYELSDNSISLLDSLVSQEACDGIIKNIRSLSKKLSDVLYLSTALDHSIEEISELLNISNDAVRQRLSRAKRQIRKMYSQEAKEHK
jgi:RNA polymerase sigma-70 factor (ECF subfamily)